MYEKITCITSSTCWCTHLSHRNRTALTGVVNVNSRTNFLEMSSYTNTVFSANFGLGPPATIARRLVRCNISQRATLPINSISVDQIIIIIIIIIIIYIIIRHWPLTIHGVTPPKQQHPGHPTVCRCARPLCQ